MKVVIQNAAIKGYNGFYGRPHTDLEKLILLTPIFLLIRLVLKSPYIRLKLHF